MTKDGSRYAGSLRIMDEQISAFIKNFSALTRLANERQEPASGQLLRPVVTEYLGADPSSMATVTETFGPHRLADANNVINELLTQAAEVRLLGLSGQSRHHSELPELLGQGQGFRKVVSDLHH